MKKPILLFALKCFVIIYLTAFTNIDDICIEPEAPSSGTVKTIPTQQDITPVTLKTKPVTENLFATQL